MPTENLKQTRMRLERLAWLLDSALPLPGTRFRLGLDAVIGLLPGVGDIVGAALSSYILAEAARLGVPKSVLMRMGFNVLVEAVVGVIPFAGDIFDLAWKANQRNIALLSGYLDNPRRATKSSRVMVAGIIIVLLLVITGLIVLGYLVVRALLEAAA